MRFWLYPLAFAALLMSGAAMAQSSGFDGSRAWFHTLRHESQLQLQYDLYWTGDYTGDLDGKFGPKTYAAILVYQKRLNLPSTGALSAEELAGVSAEAQRIRELTALRVLHASSPTNPGKPALILP